MGHPNFQHSTLLVPAVYSVRRAVIGSMLAARRAGMTLVDSNVLLDVVTDRQSWADWSVRQLERAAANGPLVINDSVYAEISTRYASVDAVDSALRDLRIEVVDIDDDLGPRYPRVAIGPIKMLDVAH